jgi:hypothetical protein
VLLEVELPGARALFTARAGGVSSGAYSSLNLGPYTADEPGAVAENRRRVALRTGGLLAHGRQVHGTEVVRVRTHPQGPSRDADGQATALRGVAPVVLTADCLPVALAATGAVAMVHAGWRGLADGVLEEGVRALRDLGATGDVHAVIGPGAGACCYEVGDDVAGRFAPWARRDGRLDLKAVAAARLRDADVSQVHDVGRCTMCDAGTFFSHRASGGITGRQAGVIWRV